MVTLQPNFLVPAFHTLFLCILSIHKVICLRWETTDSANERGHHRHFRLTDHQQCTDGTTVSHANPGCVIKTLWAMSPLLVALDPRFSYFHFCLIYCLLFGSSDDYSLAWRFSRAIYNRELMSNLAQPARNSIMIASSS